MQKVIILKGLPASGKSTYAKKLIDKHPGQYKRVNKDDLRAMIDNGKWSKSNENFVMSVRDKIITAALSGGYSVIVDDTNFHPAHEQTIRQIAEYMSVSQQRDIQVEIKTFDVDVEECIKRDLQRPVSVGEKVIRRMYKQYLCKNDIEQYQYTPGLQSAIICDIDGTLAVMQDRGPYDWHKVGNDTVNNPVRQIVNQMSSVHDIILLSGRDSICRSETEEWLKKHGIHYNALYMREENDNRKDVVIKHELFNKHINGEYNVEFVLDDRNQVVQLWRSIGLVCLQVNDGDF